MPPRPALLCILDGWGFRPDHAEDNAIAAAATPNYTRLLKECPHALLETSGNAVGLPKGQMGNSEVGHMNIGAGRVVAQDLPRIDVAIEDGSLARRPVLLSLIAKAMLQALTGIRPSWNATPSIMMFTNCLEPRRCSQSSARFFA